MSKIDSPKPNKILPSSVHFSADTMQFRLDHIVFWLGSVICQLIQFVFRLVHCCFSYSSIFLAALSQQIWILRVGFFVLVLFKCSIIISISVVLLAGWFSWITCYCLALFLFWTSYLSFHV